LKKKLTNFSCAKKYPNLNKCFGCFCGLLFLLFFSFNSLLNAQVGIGNSAQSAIVLKNGAAIYSTDAKFNQQINSDKISLQNAEVFYESENGDEVILVAASEKSIESEKKDLKTQVKIAENNKKKEELKKLEKQVSDYESQKEKFESEKIKTFPSSEEFISSTHVNTDYVVPSYHQHKLSKIYSTENQYIITLALDFLHPKKYTYYNNKPLDFCFSEVFSVRPPPFFI
jgi:hydroxymethylpyrimidine pyrophosphatase-like HAD family hydrolase